MSSNNFTVKFGRVGRTLEYDDQEGQLVFTIDRGSRDNNSLCLEHWPAHRQTVQRYRVAFERTKEYLASCGYSVEVYGEVAPSLSLTASDVRELVESELNRETQSVSAARDLTECLLPPTLLEFRSTPSNESWQLWLVFEEPRRRLRIVFDERTRHFGLAHGNTFEGFHGTFLQTLDAISKVA